MVRGRLLRRMRWEEEIGLALCCLLDALEQGIRRYRKPLPDLLQLHSGPFPEEILRRLRAGQSFSAAWNAATESLPSVYRTVISPLGETLTGGDTGGLIKLTREEVYRIAGEKRQAFQQQSRLVTVVCLSASMLVVVVLI